MFCFTVCSLSDCLVCSSDGSCAECAEGYQDDGEGGCEHMCQVENCAECNANAECIRCRDNFFMSNGACVECQRTNCNHCDKFGW